MPASSTPCPSTNCRAKDWRRMLDVHLNGSFYLSQPAYRFMKAHGGGRFVFISSSAGLFGQPNSAHYAAAKAGVVGLANVIAIDGAPYGILANTVLPFGYSRMVAETIGDRDELGVRSRSSDRSSRNLCAHGRLPGQPGVQLHPPELLSAPGRFARVFVGLGEGWVADPAAPVTAEAIEAHMGGWHLSIRSRPRLDL